MAALVDWREGEPSLAGSSESPQPTVSGLSPPQSGIRLATALTSSENRFHRQPMPAPARLPAAFRPAAPVAHQETLSLTKPRAPLRSIPRERD